MELERIVHIHLLCYYFLGPIAHPLSLCAVGQHEPFIFFSSGQEKGEQQDPKLLPH